MKKLILTFAGLAVFALINVGCHTIQGAGRDIQVVGEKGQKMVDPQDPKPADYAPR